MSLRYCFEESKVLRTLNASKPHDLAVIDTDGISTAAVKATCARGVWVYGYINAGSLERERSYYGKFKHLRIAKYDGWDGEYWIDPTADEWKEHIVALAKTIKATGAIGVYLDNTDIYYMCGHGFKNPMRKAPSKEAVYHALEDIVDAIQTDIGLIVMPNGGDDFVRRFITEHPGIIQTINQEGLFYENFKRNSAAEIEYRKSYMKWAATHISGKVRGIEYCKKPAEIAYAKAYYAAHGWDVYISKHTDLRGD